MTTIKSYSNGQWRTIADGAQGTTGPTGPTGTTGPQGDWSAAQPSRAWSTSTTLATADAGRLILLDTSTAMTVPSTLALTVGQRIDMIVTGTTAPTITAGSGVTVASTSTLKLRGQYAVASLLCIGSGSYVLSGDLLNA